jgi:hypothetical protein
MAGIVFAGDRSAESALPAVGVLAASGAEQGRWCRHRSVPFPDRRVLHACGAARTKEIARLLDVPLGTVLARLHRGRKRFEQELWAYAQETGLLLRGTVR